MTPTPLPVFQHELVFTSYQDGNYELYAVTITFDDLTETRIFQISQPRRLTYTPEHEHWPRWSPDRRQLAFSAGRAWAETEIYTRTMSTEVVTTTLPFDGRRRLTANTTHDTRPIWRPDGWQLAYVSEMAGFLSLEVLSLGAGPVSLASQSITSARAATISWLPVVRLSQMFPRIQAADERSELDQVAAGEWGMVTISETTFSSEVGTTARTRTGSFLQPAWTANGLWVAFVFQQQDPDTGEPVDAGEICIMDNTGAHFRCLTKAPDGLRLAPGATYVESPTWSPGGNWLAFTMLRDGNQDIYIKRVATPPDQDLYRLTYDPAPDREPTWSADVVTP